jgi:L-iditol 2-dehydrogenase
MPQFPCGRCALCVSGEYIHCQHAVNPAEFTGAPEGRATMAQYLVKPDWILPRITDGISTDHGAMACCGLGPSFGALERMAVGPFDTVLITGMGPVGLGGVINAKYRGARVIAVESHPWRQQKAKELGADEVLAPGDDLLTQVEELTEGLGVDQALDCSGAVSAHRLGIDAVKRRGQMAFVGECRDETPVQASQDMIRKGITLVGSWHYNLNDLPRLMQVIARSGAQLDRLITHEFPLAKIEDAFDLQLTGDCGKVLLRPWES